MLVSLASCKPTVNESDLNKLRSFADDFGQDGRDETVDSNLMRVYYRYM